MPQLNHSNLIDWFQNTIGIQYPHKVQQLLKLMVASETEIEIIFDIPKWGLFKVLDFKPVEKIMNDPHFVARDREVFSNPYFISRALEGYDEFLYL